MLVLITLNILFSLSALAQLPKTIVGPCKDHLSIELKHFHSKEEWVRVVDTVVGEKTYRSPTEKFGQWVEFHMGEKAPPILSVINSSGIKEIRWEVKSCTIKTSSDFIPFTNGLAIKGPRFNDKDFEDLIKKKESFVLYTWSPRMTYSIQFMKDFEAIAQKLKLKFIPVLDPETSDQDLQKALGDKINYKIQRSASVEMLMRQMLTHFPTSLVVYKGHITAPVITGVMTKEKFELMYNTRIMSLLPAIIAKEK